MIIVSPGQVLTGTSPVVASDTFGNQQMISLFGDAMTGSRHPDILAKFATGIDAHEVFTTDNPFGIAGALVDSVNGSLEVSATTGLVGGKTVSSRETVRYRPGYAMIGMFTMAIVGGDGGDPAEYYMEFGNGKDGFRIGKFNGDIQIRHYRGGVLQTTVERVGFKDSLDGNGPSGIDWDIEKISPFFVTLGHLGVADVTFAIHKDGKWHEVHTLKFSNLSAETHMINPSCKIIASAMNFTNATSGKLITASWSGGSIHGFDVDRTELDRSFNFAQDTVSVLTGGAETYLFSMKNQVLYNSVDNFVKLYLSSAVATFDGTGNDTGNVFVYLNSSLTNAAFADVPNGGDSIVDIDIAATAGFSNGILVGKMPIARNTSNTMDFIKSNVSLFPGDQLTFIVKSTNNGILSHVVNWIEKH